MAFKKDIYEILKKYKLFSIIGWITLIPTAVSIGIKFGIDFDFDWIEHILVGIASASGVLLFISWWGKFIYWIRLFKQTIELKYASKIKNKLILLLVLSIFIPFIPLFLYKRALKS